MTFKTAKDPRGTVDYEINWADTMSESSPADTISTSSWTANHGVTVDSDSKTTSTTSVWVSSGTKLKYADLVNKVVTAAARTHYRTVTLKLQNR